MVLFTDELLVASLRLGFSTILLWLDSLPLAMLQMTVQSECILDVNSYSEMVLHDGIAWWQHGSRIQYVATLAAKDQLGLMFIVKLVCRGVVAMLSRIGNCFVFSPCYY